MVCVGSKRAKRAHSPHQSFRHSTGCRSLVKLGGQTFVNKCMHWFVFNLGWERVKKTCIVWISCPRISDVSVCIQHRGEAEYLCGLSLRCRKLKDNLHFSSESILANTIITTTDGCRLSSYWCLRAVSARSALLYTLNHSGTRLAVDCRFTRENL